MATIQMSKNWWVDKETEVHVHNVILLSYKNRWNYAFCCYVEGSYRITWWMKLEGKRHRMISSISGTKGNKREE